MSMKKKTLPRTIVSAIGVSKILGVRAGARSSHRFTGFWPIVVDGRVFGRSWSLEEGGWYRTFCEDPLGVLQIGERTVRVRAVPVRSERLRDAIDEAYAQKYPTQASRAYVRGFRSQRRRDASLEFVPR